MQAAVVPLAAPVEEEFHVRALHTSHHGHHRHSSPAKSAPSPTPTFVTSTNPLLWALQQNIEKPFLDPKDPEGFAEFARQWQEWSKYHLYQVPPGPDGDMMRRDLLLTRVHPALRERFNEEIARNPGLTFQEVWEELSSQFTVDNPN